MGTTAIESPLDALHQLARNVAGSDVRIEDLTRSAGMPSIVWRLTPTASDPMILKQSATPKHYRREMAAYETLLPHLRHDDRWAVPLRITREDEICAFVCTALPGVPADQVEGPLADQMFEHAGALAHVIHGIPRSNPVDGQASLQRRLAHYLVPDAGIDDALLADTLAALDDGRSFAHLDTVWVHGDYSPRNWMFDASQSTGRLGVFDWERFGSDFILEDMQRMAYDHWHRCPAWRAAFFDGYGRSLTVPEQQNLRLLAWAASVAAIPWSRRSNDTAFETLCMEMIERIRADDEAP